MQFSVYGNTGKSVVYPLLLDVTSDIIGQLNRRIVIPLLPIFSYRNILISKYWSGDGATKYSSAFFHCPVLFTMLNSFVYNYHKN